MSKPSEEQKQIQNSKEAQKQESKEIQKDKTIKNEEGKISFQLNEKDGNSLEKAFFEQDKKDQKKHNDENAKIRTESNKQENKGNKTTKAKIIKIPESRIIDAQSKNQKKNKKINTTKNSGENEPNILLDNKFSNQSICIEKKNLPISDYLNKKRKREIKINEKSKKFNITENVGGLFDKFSDQFDYEDDAEYKYKGFKKKLKNSQIVNKNKITENSQGFKSLPKKDYKLDNYELLLNQNELLRPENIFLFPIFINVNINYNSDEEINVDIIRNISTNHPRNIIIHSQIVIMNNYYSLSVISTKDKTN